MINRGLSDIGSINWLLREKILLNRKCMLKFEISQIFFSFTLCKKELEKCQDYSMQNSLGRKKSYEFRN